MPIVSQRAFALFMDVSRETVGDWISKGAIPKQADGKLDLQQCLRALVKWQAARLAGRPGAAGGLDLSAERAKLAAEQTQAAAIKNAVARGDLVAVRTIAELVEGEYSVVRERLQTIPGKAADGLVGRTRVEIEDALIDEINEALNELHDPAARPWGGGAERGVATGAADSQTAAQAVADPVGQSIPPGGGKDLGKSRPVED
jgi:phage terminase Nu1 subunit (DNA packaging protein)